MPGEVVTADSEKEFYNHLLKIIENEPLNNVITVLDNFNARIGDNSHKSNSQIIGNTNYHYKTNDNGKRLVSICQQTNLRQVQSCFLQPSCEQWTWKHSFGANAVRSNTGNHKVG